MEEKKIPGHLLLHRAAVAVIKADEETLEEKMSELLAHLFARRDEQLPDDQAPYILQEVLLALIRTKEFLWHEIALDFIRCQIGLIVLENFLVSQPSNRRWQLFEATVKTQSEYGIEICQMFGVIDLDQVPEQFEGLMKSLAQMNNGPTFFTLGRKPDPEPHLN